MTSQGESAPGTGGSLASVVFPELNCKITITPS